jgi:23S rRNA (adenine2503-C2)-methyltransferase
VNRYGATRAEIAALLASWDEPAYRAGQVWDGLYAQRAPLENVTNLSRTLRTRIADALPLAFRGVYEATAADGLTTKWLWEAGRDGVQIETVLMRSAQRATVCVSSQAGCAMACTFCATGQAGLDRHLDTGEIVEQVMRAQHGSAQRVSNVVFMGMGEPLANYDSTWGAIERLHHDVGISARHITVSTVGVVPGMRRLATEALPVTLAVSLHAPDDSLRETLVPLNRRYPIADVLDAAAEVAGAHGRRVSFEYAAIAGINDRPEHAEALGHLLARWPGVGGAHVNVIPLNPTAGFPGRASSPSRIRAFADGVRRLGVNTTIRRNRGVDIDAACGQLRTRLTAPGAAVPSPAVGPARMGP